MRTTYCVIAGLVTVAVAVILARVDPFHAREDNTLTGLAAAGVAYLGWAAVVGVAWPAVLLGSVIALAGALLIRACHP